MARTIEIPIVEKFLPFLNHARYKGAHGGRGSAKSHTFADLLVEYCLLNPGTRAMCVREFQTSLDQSVKRLIEDKIKLYNVEDQFRILDSKIETPGGGVIIFIGLQAHNSDSIKSLEAFDIVWCEEAQSLSERSLELLRPTLRKETSELWFSWNPEDPRDPVDKLLRGPVVPDDAVVIEANYNDNPFFPAVLRKEMEYDLRRDPEKHAHIWRGKYRRQSQARVFKNWKIADTAEEMAALDQPPDDALFYYGADWGFSVDPSVLVRLRLVGTTLYISHEAYQVGCEIDGLEVLFDNVPGAREWEIVADSARPETISYLQRHGFPRMVAAIKGANSVKEGVIFLQNYDIVVHPRCIHTIEELTDYAYVVDKKTMTVTPILADKKNHVIDSLRYAVEKLRVDVSDDWLIV